jgi:hypothetical protein
MGRFPREDHRNEHAMRAGASGATVTPFAAVVIMQFALIGKVRDAKIPAGRVLMRAAMA